MLSRLAKSILGISVALLLMFAVGVKPVKAQVVPTATVTSQYLGTPGDDQFEATLTLQRPEINGFDLSGYGCYTTGVVAIVESSYWPLYKAPGVLYPITNTGVKNFPPYFPSQLGTGEKYNIIISTGPGNLSGTVGFTGWFNFYKPGDPSKSFQVPFSTAPVAFFIASPGI
jgi:hypothetical protein